MFSSDKFFGMPPSTRSQTPRSSRSKSSSSGQGNCFVTVGTTQFDSLVAALDENAEEIIGMLTQCGISSLTLQIGRGTFEPSNLIALGKKLRSSKIDFNVDFFRFSPSIQDYISRASLVISHGGDFCSLTRWSFAAANVVLFSSLFVKVLAPFLRYCALENP